MKLLNLSIVAFLYFIAGINLQNSVALPLTFVGQTTNMSIAAQPTRNSRVMKIAPIARSKANPKASGSNTLFLLRNGQAFGPIVMGVVYKKNIYTFSAAKKAKICAKSSARAIMGLNFSKAKKSTRIVLNESLGLGYLNTITEKKALDATSLAKIDSQCAPIGARHRLGTAKVSAKVKLSAMVRASGDTCGDTSNDKDSDGTPDSFDVDNNNDTVLDNDDTQCNDISNSGKDQQSQSFWMFSNYHLNFQDSLNMSMPGLTITKEMIDSRLRENNGLAIQVIGGGSLPVELDCDGLSYCSAGGTGRVNSFGPGQSGDPFPGEPGGTYDADADGLGSITPGNTNDFQLKTNASSDEIQSGNVLIEQVTQSDNSVLSYAGMLNYLFTTTPALKTLQVSGGATYDISYPVKPGDPGTDGYCFHVPASGDVVLTLTMWRPQRKGNTQAGEAAYMDMGNLRYQTNIPNAPQIPGGPTLKAANSITTEQVNGPGTCYGREATFPSIDSNFTRAMDSLQDHLGDVPTSPANTFTYTVNLSECFKATNNMTNTDVSWPSGAELRLPLQMTNQYGDTAVQNICLVRD